MTEAQLRSQLKYHYNMTLEHYERLLISQKGVCAICLQPETCVGKGNKVSRLCVDHDHVTEEIRGLLCRSCNLGIGKFKDKPEVLVLAIAYLNGIMVNPQVDGVDQ